jgi:hypothetical protein
VSVCPASIDRALYLALHRAASDPREDKRTRQRLWLTVANGNPTWTNRQPLTASFLLAVSILTLLAISGPALTAEIRSTTFVDDNGIMRWTASREEIAQFGVNYTTPFAHAFRAHSRLGIRHETAIDADVYHFARLGLDAFRVHVWDREISDAQGNLVVNDHVRAFDYLLAALKKRGIKIILTPLQFGNAGYPEGGTPLEGFSSRYGKQGSLENRESWPLQERYLAQFVSHVNPHTGLAYKDDSDILAFEICNEPGHFEYGPTLEYINRMARAIRATGSAKPIFYNMSHGIPVFEAYLDADVDGGTFQWYPANLVANHEQRGNFLPYLDEYPIPFAGHEKFKRKAKIVYEFDAADIGGSYLYPAMARAFRQAGMQFAAQFAYDPMYIAAFNTEYQTHYLNLAYAPQRALSMKIAGEAFRRVPLYKSYGSYPHNTKFAGVRLSYAEDLAELVTAEKYFHSNDSSTRPPHPGRLMHIAGFGNSPIVTYPGQGAYFLDRLERGVWRLEVMPDAIRVRDPFEKPSPHKHVVRIGWNEWPMRIDLLDLGRDFEALGLNDGNDFIGHAQDGTLKVRPGAYLLTRHGTKTKWDRDDRWQNITLKEFVAPPASLDKTYVQHMPPIEATANRKLRVTATVASPNTIEKVELVAYPPRAAAQSDEGIQAARRVQPGGGNTPGTGSQRDNGARSFEMLRSASGLEYFVDLPAEEIRVGILRYHIVVKSADGHRTFPSMIDALPTDWHFYGEGWSVRVVPADAPIMLFDAATDAHMITADYRDVSYDIVPSDRPGTSAMNVLANKLVQGDHDHSFRFFFVDKIRGRTADLGAAQRIVVYGRSATDQPCDLQVALVTADGIAYGAMLTLGPEHGSYSVPISALQPARAPNIPHGYPVYIPFWSSARTDVPLDMDRVESLLISVGPGIPRNELNVVRNVDIERVWME